MRTPPAEMIRVLAPFAPLFSKRVWQHAQTLLMGVVLAPGKRTVSSALRAMGLDQEKRFHRYHRVLSRAKWSTRGCFDRGDGEGVGCGEYEGLPRFLRA